jgi:hypothetical protein
VITGPDEGAAGRGRLRASHADRERVIDALKAAFADGRLDKDELDARVGQTLAARTYAELATATVGIPAGPAPAPPEPRRRPSPAARSVVNKEAVRWGLVGAGAMVPPAMFVAALYGRLTPLGLLAFPLLFIELFVMILFVAVTLAKQRGDRSRATGGPQPPRPGQAGRAVEAERHGSVDPDPALPRTRTDQPGADLRIYRPAPGAA